MQEQKEEEPKHYQIPAHWKLIIVAVILVILGGIVAMLWKSVGKSVGGGRGRLGRWGARGGDCGCVAP